ncbi:isoamyl acetate-hydrolyzing esterase 1 homolog [Amblyomma americanum]
MAKALSVLFSCLVLNVLDLGSTSDINGTAIDTARVDYPRIWLLGDSLTQLGFSAEGCWATILANHYSRKCDVLVRGFSGYNTRGGKYVLRRLFDRHDASLVAAFVIMLGTNDSPTPQNQGGAQLALEEYTANLEEMLDYLQDCGLPKSKIILATPPPLDQYKWSVHTGNVGRPTMLLARVQKFAEACLNAGAKHGVQTLNTFDGLLAEPNWRALFRDGVHFSAAGAHKFAKLLTPVLDEVVGNRKLVFPDFRAITPANPGREINEWNADQ